MKNKDKQLNNTTEICNKCKKPKKPNKSLQVEGVEYCNCGRPTKLTKKFMEVAKEIISDDIKSIIHTDEDLLFLINEELVNKGFRDNTITRRTFINWKNKVKEVGDMDEGIESFKDENVKQFFHLIKKALIKQKENLFRDMRDTEEKKSWQRYAWILERKFNEWNIRHQLSVDKTEKLIIEVDKDE